MEIALDKINDTEALIKITLKQDDYQKSVDEKIKDYSKKANIKGFRPGKVPVGMIKKMYGTSILVDEINGLLSKNLMEYLQQSDLQILAEPVPNSDKASAIDWDNQKDFEFEYNIGFAEDFNISIDKKLKLDMYKIEVTDDAINETIENVTKQFGESVDAEKAEEASTVVASMKVGDDFDKEVYISVEQLEKSGIKALKGKKAEDEVKINLDKDISETYLSQIVGGEELGDAKEAVLTLKEIKSLKPAELNAELFKKAIPNEDIETEEQFRDKVKSIISENYDRESDFFFNQKIREKLIEKAKINLPDQFLKDFILRNNEGVTEETVEKEYNMYADELKWSLIKGKIAKDQDMKVEYQDVVNEAKNMIRLQFAGSGMVGEQFESSLDGFAANYLQGENGENYRKVHNQVESQKVFEFIKENATINEKTVGVEEFRKL